MIKLKLDNENYSYMWKIANNNEWSIASTINRITKYLEQYKSGQITASQYLKIINNL
ncbi:MAG: hypothetical protein Q7T74_06440 [Candidatus Saccharibacteria bacterium]|nr:hypothetical protein [Candidatus Saccharibacteria bacterium]